MSKLATRRVRIALVVATLAIASLAAACAPPAGKGQVVVHREGGSANTIVSIQRLVDGSQWRVVSETTIAKSIIVPGDPGRYRVGIKRDGHYNPDFLQCDGAAPNGFNVAVGQTVTCYLRTDTSPTGP